jgi:hypothetical protein
MISWIKRNGFVPLTLFGLALFIRAWRYLSSHLARDGTIGGVMSLSILEGDFPIFFLGQKFMGVLDSYLSAPIYWIFGPSTLTNNFLSTLLSLGTLWVTYLTLKQVLGRPGSLMGLFYLAVPTAISLFCLTEGKAIYLLPIFLGALLMWITLKVGKETCSGAVGLCWAWGLIAGLAFWINFLSAVVIGAGLIYLVLVLRWRTLLKFLARAFPGSVLGALPLVIFTLFRDWPWIGLVKPGTTYTLTDRLSAIFLNALPIVLGINPRDNTTGLALRSFDFMVFLVLFILLLWAMTALVIRGIRSPRREVLLPLLVLVFSLGAALVGGRPNDYRGQDQRYLLPLYLALPFCWGYWADRLRHRQAALILLGLLLAGVHISGYVTFKGRAPLLDLQSGHYFNLEKQLKATTQRLRDQGFHHLYHNESYYSSFPLTFLAGGDPVFSISTTSEDAKGLARIGASFTPGYWMPLEANFKLLGAPYRSLDGIYSISADPEGADTILDSKDWKAYTLSGLDLGRVLQDGDLTTGFNTLGTNPDGQGLLLDLGRETMVSGFALVPQDYQEVPAGLRIETAGPDQAFQVIREVRDYVGPFYLSGPHPFLMTRYPRIECYFSPRPVRYLRLTQMGNIRTDWPVKEILVFGPKAKVPDGTWPEAADRLLETIKANPLKSLYADAWPSSLLYVTPLKAKPRLLLPNRHVDPYGSMIPDPLEPLILDPSPGNGLLVFNREVPLVTARLTRSGIAYEKKDAGRYTLLKLLGRTKGPVLIPEQITSEVNPQEASELVRGIPPGKRWSSGLPQKTGIGLTLDLGRIQSLAWVTLSCPRFPQDFPRGLKASYSLDGKRWTPVGLDLAEPLAFTGQVLLLFRGPTQRYRLDPAIQARFLRLELSESDPVYWWSVEALQLHGSMEPGS